MLQIGSHVNYESKTGLLGCVNTTLENGANAFMFYTGAPQNTRRSKIDFENVAQAKAKMEEEKIPLQNVIVHAPYIINLANRQEEEKWRFAISFLIEEINRVSQFGFSYLVLHPGSHVGEGVQKGICNIQDALNEVLEKTKTTRVVILLETMAGKGTEVGKNLEELKAIYDGVKAQERIGICLDTCHLNDAGYDLYPFTSFLDLFEKYFPLSKIGCIHVNDSKNAKASHKDRHENIGFGTLDFETILDVVYNKRLEDVPKILETPYINHLYAPYKKEIAMLRAKQFQPNLFQEEQKNFEK